MQHPRLRLLVTGDVDEAGDMMRRHAIAVDATDRQPLRIQAAIPAPAPHLTLPVPELCLRRPDAAMNARLVRHRKQQAGIAAERIHRTVAGNPGEGLVDADDPPATVDDGNAPGSMGEKPTGKVELVPHGRVRVVLHQGTRAAACCRRGKVHRQCARPGHGAPLVSASFSLVAHPRHLRLDRFAHPACEQPPLVAHGGPSAPPLQESGLPDKAGNFPGRVGDGRKSAALVARCCAPFGQ